MPPKPILDLVIETVDDHKIGRENLYHLATHHLIGKERRTLLRIMSRTRRKGAELDHYEARHAVHDLEIALVPRIGHRRWTRFITACVEIARVKLELEDPEKGE